MLLGVEAGLKSSSAIFFSSIDMEQAISLFPYLPANGIGLDVVCTLQLGHLLGSKLPCFFGILDCDALIAETLVDLIEQTNDTVIGIAKIARMLPDLCSCLVLELAIANSSRHLRSPLGRSLDLPIPFFSLNHFVALNAFSVIHQFCKAHIAPVNLIFLW